jgi:CheY-like chemotaxis protein
MRIMVAEDEEDIQNVYSMILNERGHDVIVTSNGQECLKVYGQKIQEYHDRSGRPRYFDVVILDYKMPKKDGLQAAKEILDLNPEQRIIFASAYVKETLTESVKELKRVVELMQKPFSMSALVDIVENKEAYQGLKQLMTHIKDIKDIKGFEPTTDQITELFEGLRKIQKYRY